MDRMTPGTVQLVIETLKEEGIDLVAMLPEEPSYPLTHAIRADPYFQAISVAAEGHGIALCAGASIGGRRCLFMKGSGSGKSLMITGHMDTTPGIREQIIQDGDWLFGPGATNV